MTPTVTFDNHVFISYTHVDNDHLSAIPQGWIDVFHEALLIRLKQLFDRSVTIWRDTKLRGVDEFDAVIADKLSRTAILLSVISPDYLKSKSCKEELDQFFNFAAGHGGLEVQHKKRVVSAIKTYVPIEERPVKDTLGYEFFTFDAARDIYPEYDYVIMRDERDKRFWDKVEDVAWDLTRLLRDITGKQTVTEEGATVYLAETTIDMREERENVRRELQQQGHVVMPDEPLPGDLNALKEKIREYLVNSKLSIHIVGGFYDTLVRLQHELAVEREATSDFPRLIWMPTGLQPIDESQSKFIKEVRDGFTGKNGSELLETKLEDLKTEIGKKLSPKPQQAAEATLTDQPYIYLICDKADRDGVAPLLNYLLWEKGFNAKLSLMEGDSTAIREDRKQNLLACDGVIVFFGNVGDQWLTAQRDEFRKVAGYGRTKPLCRAVYVAAPKTDMKELLQCTDPLIIKNFDTFKSDSLDEFINKVMASKGVTQ